MVTGHMILNQLENGSKHDKFHMIYYKTFFSLVSEISSSVYVYINFVTLIIIVRILVTLKS